MNNIKICRICEIHKDILEFQVNNRVCMQCKNKKNYDSTYFKEYYINKTKELLKKKYLDNQEHYKTKSLNHYNKLMDERGRKPRGRPKKEILVEKVIN